ncbi:venom serine protease-like [Anopheles moucheti]|uniref:venom serine protease-like n=1 Tax=Anopheles moucheti TaxID=186751 RepID=UPI0022F00953|nr:venom serine protease-like [Anopheles moucheti]
MWWKLVPVVLALACCTRQVQGQCSFILDMKFGSVYQLISPQYPSPYEPNLRCTYHIRAPYGYRIALDCPTFQIPSSTNCMLDSFRVSRSGLVNFSDAIAYCGAGRLQEKSDGNVMSIQFTSAPTSNGGLFSCQLSIPQQNCECGRKKTQRIVNGVETMVNEFPMMAALIDVKTKTVICGATIVTNGYALTAAHCLLQRTTNDTALLVGDHNIKTGSDTSYSQVHIVAQFMSHPSFTVKPLANDVALVRTQQPIQYNPGVGPVCLPWRYTSQTFEGSTVVATGWGDLDFGGPRATALNKVQLDVIGNSDCSRQIRATVPAQQLCTFTPKRDTCQADSGGPLFYTNPSTGLLYNVGIVSFGIACATEKPSVNTRVTEYLDWIIANTPRSFYCYQ